MEKNIKRLIFIFLILFFLFVILMFRITIVASNPELKEKANMQQTIKINLTKNRANFLDRNLVKLTNRKKIKKALIFNKENLNEETLKELGVDIKKEKLEGLQKENRPVVFPIKNNTNKNIFIFDSEERYSDLNNTPTHLIGYVNKEGNGVSGLEYYLNDYLNQNKFTLDIEFKKNTKKYSLEDASLESTGNKDDGVVLTIDSTLQYILNSIAEKQIDCGAGLIMSAKTGEILAITSFPIYNPNDIEKELKSEKKPLFNRYMQKNPVGSIFKIVTAATALENNISKNLLYFCKGYYDLNGTKFHCHKREGHSYLDLKGAMIHSCNPYFIDLGLKLGAKKLLKTTKKMGFTRKISLLDTLYCDVSTLSDEDMTKGELSNFSFGQGKLKASMLHIAQMLSIICNDGIGVVPQIIKGYVKNNKFTSNFKPIKFNSISESTAKTLKEILTSSIKDTKAESLFIDSGGKSSTAQTGQFKDKKEILNTWFCSFTPAADPQYILVLFKEDGVWGINDLGPLVKKINSYLSFKTTNF